MNLDILSLLHPPNGRFVSSPVQAILQARQWQRASSLHSWHDHRSALVTSGAYGTRLFCRWEEQALDQAYTSEQRKVGQIPTHLLREGEYQWSAWGWRRTRGLDTGYHGYSASGGLFLGYLVLISVLCRLLDGLSLVLAFTIVSFF